MILKPENLGKIILISAVQRKKTPCEEKDKGDAKTITLLLPSSTEELYKELAMHRRPGCHRADWGKHAEPFLGGTGARSPGCSQGVLLSDSLRCEHTSHLRAARLQRPPKVPLPAGTASLRAAPATPAALPNRRHPWKN